MVLGVPSTTVGLEGAKERAKNGRGAREVGGQAAAADFVYFASAGVGERCGH